MAGFSGVIATAFASIDCCGRRVAASRLNRVLQCRSFHVNSLPTTYLIDARGKVAAFDPAGNLGDALKELLGKK